MFNIQQMDTLLLLLVTLKQNGIISRIDPTSCHRCKATYQAETQTVTETNTRLQWHYNKRIC